MKKLEEISWYQELVTKTEKSTMRSSIKMCLEVKFGTDGLELMQQINQIQNYDKLKEIFLCLVMAKTLEEVQQVL